jgi:capsular polysaccharide export protein
MQSAASYVIESFAAHASHDAHLLLKSHPLDSSFYNWRKLVRRHAEQLGLTGRLHFIDGGDLEELVKIAQGLVCVNSTSATLALAAGTPVCTIGEAIYDMPGLTHQEHLDRFWSSPTSPEPGLYPAFRRVLVDRCLVRGGLASESAVTTLIESILDRFGLNPSTRAIAQQSGNDRATSALGSRSGDAVARRERHSSAARNRG